jgi:hypothetical protein
MTDSLLDFSLSPRRKESVRFDLLDEDLNLIGRVHPVGVPTLEIERASQVKRRLSNVVLFPPQSQQVTYRTRLAPVWVFDDGTEHPLGVFYLNDETIRATGEEPLEIPMMGDGMILYRETIDKTFSVWPGNSFLDKLNEVHLLATDPAPYVAYDHITDLARTPMAWPAGTPIADIMEEIGDAAGLRIWFNSRGTLRFDVAADPEDEDLDLSNHIEGSLKVTYSNEDSPNRWIARDVGVDFSVQGVYDLPDGSPHSFAKRGRYVTREVELPGLVGADAADRAARAAALDEPFPYKTATVELPARPDLDVYSQVRLQGEQVWLLDSAETELVASGTTSVTAQVMWENPNSIRNEPRLSIGGSEPIPGDVPPTKAYMLWDPAFLKKWRSLTPRQRRKLRAYLDAMEQQRLERQERRQRRAARRRRRTANQRRQNRPHPRRSGRVQSYDPELKIATVLLDNDPQGSEVPVRLESDIPGADQRITVQFNSPTPTAVGSEGGMHRLLGYARVVANQTISATAPTAITDAEVEVAITQPGRLIVVTAQARFSVTGGSTVEYMEGIIQRDDGAGTFTDLGSFGSTLGLGDHSFGETLSGFALDPSPDPGVYAYRLRSSGTVQPYRVASAATPTLIMVWDVGADPEASFS